MVSQEASSQSLEEMRDHLRQLEPPACELFRVYNSVAENRLNTNPPAEVKQRVQTNLDFAERIRSLYDENISETDENLRLQQIEEAGGNFEKAKEAVACIYRSAEQWYQKNTSLLNGQTSLTVRKRNLLRQEARRFQAAMLLIDPLEFMHGPIQSERNRTQ